MNTTKHVVIETLPLSAPRAYATIRHVIDGWQLQCGESIWLALTLIEVALSTFPEEAQLPTRRAIARAIVAGENPQ